MIFEHNLESNPLNTITNTPLQPSTDTPQPLRILVAEDNRLNQHVIIKMLQKLGYAADVAVNGLEVLDALQHHSYDVILMDVHMPELDGFEATRRIRDTSAHPHDPWIIAMTAYSMESDSEWFLAAGMNDYVGKPIDRDALARALQRVTDT